MGRHSFVIYLLGYLIINQLFLGSINTLDFTKYSSMRKSFYFFVFIFFY